MSKKKFTKVLVAGLLAAPLLALAHGPAGESAGACAHGGMHRSGMHQGGMHAGHGMGPLRGLDLTPAQQEQLQAERAKMRTEMQARLRAVLTPEQRQKLDERMSRHQGQCGHHS